MSPMYKYHLFFVSFMFITTAYFGFLQNYLLAHNCILFTNLFLLTCKPSHSFHHYCHCHCSHLQHDIHHRYFTCNGDEYHIEDDYSDNENIIIKINQLSIIFCGMIFIIFHSSFFIYIINHKKIDVWLNNLQSNLHLYKITHIAFSPWFSSP